MRVDSFCAQDGDDWNWGDILRLHMLKGDGVWKIGIHYGCIVRIAAHKSYLEEAKHQKLVIFAAAS